MREDGLVFILGFGRLAMRRLSNIMAIKAMFARSCSVGREACDPCKNASYCSRDGVAARQKSIRR